MLSRFERHQAASYGAAAVPSKTMDRQTPTTPDGTERHRRFYLAVLPPSLLGLCSAKSDAGRRQADGSRPDVVKSGVVGSGRESEHAISTRMTLSRKRPKGN